jgi:hypothetical protein
MLKLVQVDNAVFDLAFDDPAADDADAAVATLVYAALFTDAEAPIERVPDRFDRRGWWADPAVGSGIWHVRRQPLGSSARREAIGMLKRSLEVRTPGLSDIDVREIALASGGSVSSVVAEITGLHNGRSFVLRVPL